MKNATEPGWVSARLGDLCYFENGDRGKNYPGRKSVTEAGVPFINAGHLNNGTIDWERMDHIPEDHFRRLGSGKIKKGDILYCLRGSLGKFGFVERETEGAIASSLVIVRAGPKVLREYLGYYFGSDIAEDMIQVYAGGAAQPNLSAASLKAFILPLPPLEEQRRIAAKLDEAFVALDRARALSELNRAGVSHLAAVFLDDQISTLFEKFGQVRIDRVAQVKGGKRLPKGEKTTTAKIGFPYINVRDMTDSGSINTDTVGFHFAGCSTRDQEIHDLQCGCVCQYRRNDREDWRGSRQSGRRESK